MDPEWIPIIVGTTFILTTGAVLLLRPITKRLGTFLEVLVQERRSAPDRAGQEELRRSVEEIDHRVRILEERLRFTEDLLHGRDARRAVEAGVERRPLAATAERSAAIERRDPGADR